MEWRKHLISCLIGLTFLSFKGETPGIRILFTGDILLSRNVSSEIKAGNTDPWQNLHSFFHSADLVIGNLEGAVGRSDQNLTSKTLSPLFNIDGSYISLLRNAGFKVITIENNHSLDLGLHGKAETANQLRKNNIIPVYYNNSPQFYTIRGTVIGIVALNLIPSGDSSKNQLPSIEIRQKLRLARSLSNIVIVSVHWGSELLEWPGKEQREIAKWLVKNGADVIIGSHPHVIQMPEMIEGRPVFFSLGNHLFDQKYPKSKEGMIAEIQIKNDQVKCKALLSHTGLNSFFPVLTKEADLDLKSFKCGSSFSINEFSIKPFSLQDTVINKIILRGYINDQMIWSTHPMPVVSIAKAKFDGHRDNLFLLEKHYSRLDKETNVRPYVYRIDNKGIYALWRGSGLAWPLLDAVPSPIDQKTLCVLHRGDSYINLDKQNKSTHIALYKWNGFGFTGINDSIETRKCENLFSN